MSGAWRSPFGGDQKNDSLKQVVDALAGLARNAHGVIGGNGELIFNLGLHLIGMGAGQIDLVDCGNNVEIGVHGKRGVGDRLGLNTLRGVHNEHRAFARRKTSYVKSTWPGVSIKLN